MNPPLLVVVTGSPASGKTTLARALTAQTELALFERDSMKETLFDSLGTGDRKWSRKLGAATFPLLLDAAARVLSSGSSVIVEANFTPGIDEKTLAALPTHRSLQLWLNAPAEILDERLRARHDSADRHPGHIDQSMLAEVAAGIASGRWAPLELEGTTLHVDTSSTTDIASIAKLIHGELNR